MPGGSAFKAKFEAKYGKIQNYSPYAYDAMHVLNRGDEARPFQRSRQILAELPKTDYQGVTGHIASRQGRHHRRRVTLYQVKDGAWQTLETVQSGK